MVFIILSRGLSAKVWVGPATTSYQVSLEFVFHWDYAPRHPPSPRFTTPTPDPSAQDYLLLFCPLKGPWLGWITTVCSVSTQATPTVPPTQLWAPPPLQAFNSSSVFALCPESI